MGSTLRSLSEGRSRSSGSDSEAELWPSSRSVSVGVSRGVLVGVGSVESFVSERAVEGTLRRWGKGMIRSGRCRLEPLSAESATELADMSGVGLAIKLLQPQKHNYSDSAALHVFLHCQGKESQRGSNVRCCNSECNIQCVR